jgi:hypothetical protein
VEHIGITPDRKRSYPFRASGRPTTNGFGALPAGWPAATTRSPCTAPPCPCKISARRGASSRRPSRTCRLPRRAAGWRSSPAPLCSRRRLCPDTCHPRGAESAPRRHLVASRRGGPRAPARHPGKHPEVSRLRRAPVLPSGGRAACVRRRPRSSFVVAASVSKRQEYP